MRAELPPRLVARPLHRRRDRGAPERRAVRERAARRAARRAQRELHARALAHGGHRGRSRVRRRGAVRRPRRRRDPKDGLIRARGGALAVARARGRGGLDGDRDLRLAAARAVLRLVHGRLGERDRARARRPLARLLARRPPRRPAAASRGVLGGARARGRSARRGRPVRRAAAPRPDRPRPRPVSAGAVVGSFLASLLLFAPPVVLLGMAAPFAIRLAVAGVDRRRRRRGPPVRALDARQHRRRLRARARDDPARRDAADARRHRRGRRARRRLQLRAGAGCAHRVALAAVLAVPPGVVKATPGLLYETESRYQFVQVVQNGPERDLYLNEGIVKHSVWRPDTVLTGRRVGHVPRRAAAARAPAAAGRDPRQRRRHDGTRARALLPADAHRRRRDRSRR